jgi:hypothetical protein
MEICSYQKYSNFADDGRAAGLETHPIGGCCGGGGVGRLTESVGDFDEINVLVKILSRASQIHVRPALFRFGLPRYLAGHHVIPQFCGTYQS